MDTGSYKTAQGKCSVKVRVDGNTVVWRYHLCIFAHRHGWCRHGDHQQWLYQDAESNPVEPGYVDYPATRGRHGSRRVEALENEASLNGAK